MGGVLPGGTPFWLAAEFTGVRGLPIGFTGFLVGFIITVAVWVTLPIALSQNGHDQPVGDAPRSFTVVAVLPYLAVGAGLIYLYDVTRARGRTPLRAAGRALATSVGAYLICAALLFLFGIAFLSV